MKALLTLLLIVFLSTLFSQQNKLVSRQDWDHAGGPIGGTVNDAEEVIGFFVGTSSGVYFREPLDITGRHKQVGLDGIEVLALGFRKVGMDSVMVFAGTENGLYHATFHRTNEPSRKKWKRVEEIGVFVPVPVPEYIYPVIQSIDVKGDTILATTDIGEVFYSLDGGNSWDNTTESGVQEIVRTEALGNETHFISKQGLQVAKKSNDYGQSFQNFSSGLKASTPWPHHLVSTREFAWIVQGGNLYRAADSSSQWRQFKTPLNGKLGGADGNKKGLLIWNERRDLVRIANSVGGNWKAIPDPHILGGGPTRNINLEILKAKILDRDTMGLIGTNTYNRLLVGTNDGLYRYDDSTGIWSRHVNGLIATTVNAMVWDGDSTLYAGMNSGRLEKTSDNGETWQSMYHFPSAVVDLVLAPWGDMYVLTDTSGVFRSMDQGQTFVSTNQGLPKLEDVSALMINALGEILLTYESFTYIHYSPDSGKSWQSLTFDLWRSKFLYRSPEGTLYAPPEGFNVAKSWDNGHNWQNLGSIPGLNSINAILEVNNNLLVGGNGGIYYSDTSLSNPVLTDPSLQYATITAMHAIGDSILLAGSLTGVVYQSEDMGMTWDTVSGPDSINTILGFESYVDDSVRIFMAPYGMGVLRNWGMSGGSPTGVQDPEINELKKLNIYPNPANDRIYVEQGSGKFEELIVTDIMGRQMVRQKATDPSIATIWLLDLPAGIYIVRTLHKGRPTATGKFIKTR